MPQIKWIVSGILLLLVAAWYLTPLRSPSTTQMVGQYAVELPWGEAVLQLNQDGTFHETVKPKAGETHDVKGKWIFNSGWQSSLVLEPYWQFAAEGPGNQVTNTALPVESWGIRGVRIEVGDPDAGLRLRKQ